MEKRLTVRLDVNLYQRLVVAAQADKRSVNGYLSVLLDRELPDDPAQGVLDLEAAS